MNLLVKARAWQIFLLSFGIPWGFALLAGFLTRSSRDAYIFPLFVTPAMALFVGVSLAWLWSLGRFFNRRIREEVRPKDTWFRRGLIYVSIYMVVYLGFWIVFIVAPKDLSLAAATAVLYVFHFLAMAAMLYVLYFVAKNMAMAEQDREKPSGKSTAGNFLLLWFFPIGVWFIQPMANRMWREEAA